MGLNSLLKNRIIKNIGWIVGGKVVNKLLAFVIGIFTARYLGPGNYGVINYANAYLSIFAAICTLGLNSIIVKEFVESPDKEGETMGTALVMRAVSSVMSAIMIMSVVSIVDKDDTVTIVVVALSSLGLIFQIFDTFSYWFQAKLQSKYCSIATVIAYIIMSLYKIMLLASGKSVKWFAIANSIDYVVIAVILFAIYKKNGGPALSFSFNRAKKMLRASSSFILSGLMISIYGSADKFMLQQMIGEEAVGYYSLAISFSTTWQFVFLAIIDSMYPSIVNAYQENKEKFEKRNKQLYFVVFYGAIAVAFMICILAPYIINILYGAQYSMSVQPLQIVVWYTAFSCLGVARNIWAVCEYKQKYLIYIYIGTAVINVVLNYLFIPIWGVSGAAVTSLITQISTILIIPALIPALRENVKLMADAIMLKKVF